MAYSLPLTGDHAEVVRRQLGEIIGRFYREAERIEAAELAESFELYTIPGDDLRSSASRGDLYGMLQRTGSWLHLVNSSGNPMGIAHSASPGNATELWTVQSFFLSPLAPKIASAIARLDAERSGNDIEALFVAVPSYSVDFFLLRSGATVEVYLVSAPPGNLNLTEGSFYSQEELLRQLTATRATEGITTN